jgi:hypothetical protein
MMEINTFVITPPLCILLYTVISSNCARRGTKEELIEGIRNYWPGFESGQSARRQKNSWLPSLMNRN